VDILLVAPRHYASANLPYRPLRRAVSPPLGLLTVAGLTPPGHNLRVLDEGVEPIPDEIEADLVGITATTCAAPRAYELADRLRSRGTPVVLGGIHASALPAEAAAHADAVVIGEAEGQWPQVVADAQAGELRKYYRQTGWPDLAQAPPPRYDLVNPRRYVVPSTAQTTRGCPFDCSYCSVTTFFGRTYRTRRIQDVVADLERMPRGPMMFVDDNIMAKPAYARELFAALRGRGLRWFSQASLTILKTPHLILEAARAGCRVLFVGLETLSQRNLEAVGKRINVTSSYHELVSRLHDNGIALIASFMFGLDADDEAVFERTVEFARHHKIDACMFSILTPLPGTRLYTKLEDEGRIVDRDWRHYDGAHVTFRPALLSPERLQEGYLQAYRDFFSVGSILGRALQPVGWRPVYWLINLIWRHYLMNWLDGVQSPGRGTSRGGHRGRRS